MSIDMGDMLPEIPGIGLDYFIIGVAAVLSGLFLLEYGAPFGLILFFVGVYYGGISVVDFIDWLKCDGDLA